MSERVTTGGNGAGAKKRTLIEEGTELKGTMSSRCPIVVMGKLEGELSGPSMEISPTGVVAGTVVVDELRSEGEVAGEVTADTVHLSGRVRDNTVIRAQTLEVRTRADRGMEVVFGICELAVGDEPDKAAAIAAASQPPRPAPTAASPPPIEEPAPAPAPAEATPVAAADTDWDLPADSPAEPKRRSRAGRRSQPPPPT
jgi:cytoskeletal protein CcmA (bactofilin family)